jgi:hypothetical protein
MNHKIKRRWVAALRGGTYKQCTGTLCNDEGEHCVLGVLAVIQNLEISEYDHPYPDLCRLTGVTNETFWTLNDARRMSFTEIADWIEENL